MGFRSEAGIVADRPGWAWERFVGAGAEVLESEDLGIVGGNGLAGRRSRISDFRFEVEKRSDSEAVALCGVETGILDGAVAESELELSGVAELRADTDVDRAPGNWPSFPEGALPFPDLTDAEDRGLSVIGSGRWRNSGRARSICSGVCVDCLVAAIWASVVFRAASRSFSRDSAALMICCWAAMVDSRRARSLRDSCQVRATKIRTAVRRIAKIDFSNVIVHPGWAEQIA